MKLSKLIQLSVLFLSLLCAFQVTASSSPSPQGDCPDPEIEQESKEKMAEPKTAWKELMGLSGQEAKETIARENPNLAMVQVVPKDAMVSMDYREDRVRIFVDEQDKVVKCPRVG